MLEESGADDHDNDGIDDLNDLDDDNVFNYENHLKKCSFEVILVKNPLSGPCEAIKHGLNFGNSDCVIVFPADDFLNINIIDKMYSAFKNNNDIVVASRFIEGGSMKGCPLIKSMVFAIESSNSRSSLLSFKYSSKAFLSEPLN